jgi:N-glycosylase/DNA lyase
MTEYRKNDEKLSLAMQTGNGIRILRQDKWETLCSFIISQNNNIPRIKKIISALCKAGAEISGGSEIEFPRPETLVKMGKDGLFALKTGFRAAYLFDAASKVANGEIDLDAVFEMDTDRACAELCKIKGVGPKVAACTLLFGFEKYDCFPIDVWVKRVMQEYYGGLVSGKDFGRFAGLAQQYLFYHRRYIEG